jgi:hypothetical protein
MFAAAFTCPFMFKIIARLKMLVIASSIISYNQTSLQKSFE